MLNKKPQRSCVVCRRKGDKDEFIRVVFNKNGEVIIDENQKLAGRGAYICKNDECMKKIQKQKSFNRSFKKNLPQEFYEELSNYFENGKNQNIH